MLFKGKAIHPSPCGKDCGHSSDNRGKCSYIIRHLPAAYVGTKSGSRVLSLREMAISAKATSPVIRKFLRDTVHLTTAEREGLLFGDTHLTEGVNLMKNNIRFRKG